MSVDPAEEPVATDPMPPPADAASAAVAPAFLGAWTAPAAAPSEPVDALPEPIGLPAPPGPPPPRATRVPPPPSSREEGRRPVARVSAGAPLTTPLPSMAVRAPSRSHRSRRSVAAIAGWMEAAEIPEDAAGRVAFVAGEPPPPPPAPQPLPGSIGAATGPEPPPGGSHAGPTGLLLLTGWPAVALLSVVLIVLFILGMRMTR